MSLAHDMKMLCMNMISSQKHRRAELCKIQEEVHEFLCRAKEDRIEALCIYKECEETLREIRCGKTDP